jgi:hypothetical protein
MARLADLALPGHVRVGHTALEPVRRLPSAVAGIDAVLEGGWPRGRLSEVIGPPSSGKTSLVLALLAAATRCGEVVACVDLADALHPASIARAGADLQRVLWVRPPSAADGLRCTELLLHAGGFAVVMLDVGAEVPRRLRSQVWPRLMHAAERSHTAVIVLAPQRVVGSFSALSVGVRARAARWQPGAWPLFDGFDSRVELTRNKLGAPGGVSNLWISTGTHYHFGADLG